MKEGLYIYIFRFKTDTGSKYEALGRKMENVIVRWNMSEFVYF